MALGWNESNAGTLPLLLIVTYNSQWPSAQHYKRLVFQTWVPVSWITNEISLNALERSHGVFLEEAVKRVINRLSGMRKREGNLYNLGKGRYQWHLSIYLQIYLQHNITTISKQCSIKMWYLVVFSPSFISGISHCNLLMYLYFRNEWDYFPTFMQEEM